MLDEHVPSQSQWSRARRRSGELVLAVFRVMARLLFVQHGAQKLLGSPGGFRGVFLAFWMLGGGRYSADGILARRRS